ncbi:hypothetical protein [Novipirellula aureliae]|uniref:hypothetical protein n=1 Tax=Novipirellula aureliae TaxID=2527966 RepID=UPI0011B3D1B1|nr:hypothetical protein [Novipirellula aureliae]
MNDPSAQQVLSSRVAALSTDDEPVEVPFEFFVDNIDRITFHGLSGDDSLVLWDSWGEQDKAIPIVAFGGSGKDSLEGVACQRSDCARLQ